MFRKIVCSYLFIGYTNFFSFYFFLPTNLMRWGKGGRKGEGRRGGKGGKGGREEGRKDSFGDLFPGERKKTVE